MTTFAEFRVNRATELLTQERCNGGGTDLHPGLNYIGGLLQLIDKAKPLTVLEIGSHIGVSTECFLLGCKRVVAVDSWGHNWAPAYDWFMRRVGAYPNLEVVRGSSPEILTQFKDNEFDLVYIDGEHDYDPVVWDIHGSQLLAKHWIAGHDYYTTPNGPNDVHRAVNELLGEPTEVFIDTSWLIKK